MSDMSEFVTQNDTTLITDSRHVVKQFKKRNGDVLRAFDNLECSAEYYCVNFEAVIGAYTNGKGRLRRVGCQQFPSPSLTP